MSGLYIVLITTNLIIDFSHVGQLEALKERREDSKNLREFSIESYTLIFISLLFLFLFLPYDNALVLSRLIMF